jgi:hypothetical protein
MRPEAGGPIANGRYVAVVAANLCRKRMDRADRVVH